MKISMAHLLFPIAVIIFFILLMGCGTYTPQKVASHIVAVTLEGDTILVPIDRIRPNMYHSYYPVYSNYNYYRNMYHSYYPVYSNYNYYRPYYGQNNYQFRYSDNRGFSSGNSGNSGGSGGTNNKPKPVTTVPDVVIRPSAETLLKGKK